MKIKEGGRQLRQNDQRLLTTLNVAGLLSPAKIFCLVGAIALYCVLLRAQDTKPAKADDTRAYLEMLLSQSNSNKVAAYNDVLKLTAEEGEKFWPIYRDYEKELAVLCSRRLDLIREFLSRSTSGKLTDKDATELANRWFPNLEDRTALWKKYHKKISDAVSPARAAQFLQLEYELTLFVDLAISSEIPRLTPAASSVSGGEKAK